MLVCKWWLGLLLNLFKLYISIFYTRVSHFESIRNQSSVTNRKKESLRLWFLGDALIFWRMLKDIQFSSRSSTWGPLLIVVGFFEGLKLMFYTEQVKPILHQAMTWLARVLFSKYTFISFMLFVLTDLYGRFHIFLDFFRSFST